ncbi:hypothetical protein S7335_2915 [Synechococcus sp. PCC 7335]|nr:hypothetical protein S7335_2915 [Synechococcus sp. PCC 7335]
MAQPKVLRISKLQKTACIHNADFHIATVLKATDEANLLVYIALTT